MARFISLVGLIGLLSITGFWFLNREADPQDEKLGEYTKSELRSASQRSDRSLSGSREIDPRKRADMLSSLWKARNYDQVSLVFSEWLAADPDKALDFVASSPEGIDVSHFSPEITKYFDALPPAQAMEETLRLGNDHRLQETVSADSFSRWLTEDRKASLNWLFANEEHAFTDFLGERMGRLGHLGEPATALETILAYQSETLQSKLVKGVLLRWLHQDVDAAVNYLNASEPSPVYDEALNSYASQLVEESPALARIWIESIESESIRSMMLGPITQHWTDDLEAEYQDLLDE